MINSAGVITSLLNSCDNTTTSNTTTTSDNASIQNKVYTTSATVCGTTTAGYSGTITTNGSSYWNDISTTIPNYYNTNGYSLYYNGMSIEECIKDVLEKYLKEEDKDNKMNNNFGFGAYNTNNIRLSIYGMAIKNKAGKWVSYNKEENCLMDVEILNFEIDPTKIFYKIPKAIDDVMPGDVILHNDVPVFIEGYEGNNKFSVINPYEGTAVTILPLKSPFGFNYVTQIISITDMLPKATKDNPFGNLLPFIVSGSDNLPLLMMMMGEDISDIDPMMLIALTGKGDMSMFLMMQAMKKKKKQPKEYKFRDSEDLLAHRRFTCNNEDE